MKERPILFSGPMVKAILEGRKTQTRRIARLPDDFDAGEVGDSPYGARGDRLWVRETFSHVNDHREHGGCVDYRADRCPRCGRWPMGAPGCEHLHARWTPSIHMPRWASRLTLEVMGVRVERLQAITEEDARAEGVEPDAFLGESRVLFASLWDHINGKRASWASNPWVWVVSFRRIDEEVRRAG